MTHITTVFIQGLIPSIILLVLYLRSVGARKGRIMHYVYWFRASFPTEDSSANWRRFKWRRGRSVLYTKRVSDSLCCDILIIEVLYHVRWWRNKYRCRGYLYTTNLVFQMTKPKFREVVWVIWCWVSPRGQWKASFVHTCRPTFFIWMCLSN